MTDPGVEHVEFETTMWIVYDVTTGDIVATQRLSVPKNETADQAAQMQDSLLETVARDADRAPSQLAILRVEPEAPITGALFRVDVERRAVVTVAEPRRLQRGNRPDVSPQP
jgi:hypothetical protein